MLFIHLRMEKIVSRVASVSHMAQIRIGFTSGKDRQDDS